VAKYAFPAVFDKESEGGYTIYFPDIEGCYTQSDDVTEGIENASDALCLMLYEWEKENKPVPKSTDMKDITVDGESFVSLVACDTRFYKDYFESKSVKINATIPLWMKEAGEKNHVNFSAILQNGLREYLKLESQL
jgi:predicted RNase H-like HicB family nuclease